jgi:hypothetical protein
MSIDPLIGANYLQWWDKINMRLAFFKIDKAITDMRPIDPLSLRFLMTLVLILRHRERERESSKLMSV